MKVLSVFAEMAPLVKVGGVGDVGGSLPRALARRGVDARVALPYYNTIKTSGVAAERIASLPDAASLWMTRVAGVPVYLIDHEASFGGNAVYGGDEARRFLAFADALIAAASQLDWQPDVLHLHDWQPGFLAMRLSDGRDHPWSSLARVQTVHNLAFTGPFDEAFAAEHGLQWDAGAAGLAGHLQRSALAHGLLRADLVSTVSPTYAREIVTSEFGGGFERLLQQLGDRLSGIMNGIDVERYDPTTDAHLAAMFDAETLDRRAENKRALQQRMGLDVDQEIPLIGMVSRLFWQKGLDLAATAVAQLQESHRFQFAVLGQGDEENERTLAQLARRFPGRVAVRLAFDEPLGQLIYGGCDMFLMPSRYEPCGLGQLIAMRYGAVPVVRRTGGLADSVEPYDPPGGGTGFLFGEASAAAIVAALTQALAAFQDRQGWSALQRRGMARDWSWDRAAALYFELYERAIGMRARAAGTEGNVG